MQKILLISTILASTSLFSDNSLGEKISISSTQETIAQQTDTDANDNKPIHLETRASPQNIKKSFKKDHHRYDKRYSNFDYERNGYYNDDGYYYGYYDRTGYFYNNTYFTYNNDYTYRDRCRRRGHFQRSYHHRRHYIYHDNNNWNRSHQYYAHNSLVYGHYYEPRDYQHSYYNTRETYRYYNNQQPCNSYQNPVRRNVTRMSGGNSYNHSYNNHNNSRINRIKRDSTSYRNHNNRNTLENQIRRNTTRMRSTISSTHRHISISK